MNLRTITIDDAPFYLALVNDPTFIANIRDKGIRTLEDAKEDIIQGPLISQEKNGFSFYVVERKEDGVPMGLCGLVKRDTLENVDIGYAFLPQFTGQGYAKEAAIATMQFARDQIKLGKLAAITSPGNTSSNKLLQSLGFVLEDIVVLKGENKPTNLYGYVFQAPVD